MLSCLLFFIAGAFMDIIWSLLVVAIDRGQALRAAVYQGVFTALAAGATWACIAGASVPGLASYALGGAVGTYFVVRRHADTGGVFRSCDREHSARQRAVDTAHSGSTEDQ